MPETRWGCYAIVRIGGRRQGEWTNVGVILFGADGNQIAARMDPDGIQRAIGRGDLIGDWDGDIANDWDTYPSGYPTVEAVDRAHMRIGHAMSVMQLSALSGTAISADSIDRIWKGVITPRW